MPYRTASCSAISGSTSHTATTAAPDSFRISRTWFSAALPHPTTAILSIGDLRADDTLADRALQDTCRQMSSRVLWNQRRPGCAARGVQNPKKENKKKFTRLVRRQRDSDFEYR